MLSSRRSPVAFVWTVVKAVYFSRALESPEHCDQRVSVCLSVRASISPKLRVRSCALCTVCGAGSMQRSGVRPSVCPVDRQQQRCAAGLLLSAGSRCRSTVIGTQRRRSAANAGSVVSTAEERGSTQACLCMRLCRLVTGTGHNYRIARCHLPQSTDYTYASVDDFQASSLQFTRTARNSVLLGARRCRSTSPACTHGAQQQTRRTTGQTDRRTLERFTDSASRTM